ncbi:DUF5363 family protein [Reinekea marinisedimentorum]|uniref:DUF5363 family protein n=1 Tax=Reinekea marinisedimentorum TaxID=230495 RepID=A0A4R3IAT4_9GAMM|nr:DUF5363 family protein [Reinekea marinisedimentorum]TCS43699.1 hypothetical protein BCF53_10141 [Reinekea marinisedimentorum]
MLQKIKSLVNRYDNWCESMGIKTDEKRCCVPVVRFDPEKEEKTPCSDALAKDASGEESPVTEKG